MSTLTQVSVNAENISTRTDSLSALSTESDRYQTCGPASDESIKNKSPSKSSNVKVPRLRSFKSEQPTVAVGRQKKHFSSASVHSTPPRICHSLDTKTSTKSRVPASCKSTLRQDMSVNFDSSFCPLSSSTLGGFQHTPLHTLGPFSEDEKSSVMFQSTPMRNYSCVSSSRHSVANFNSSVDFSLFGATRASSVVSLPVSDGKALAPPVQARRGFFGQPVAGDGCLCSGPLQAFGNTMQKVSHEVLENILCFSAPKDPCYNEICKRRLPLTQPRKEGPWDAMSNFTSDEDYQMSSFLSSGAPSSTSTFLGGRANVNKTKKSNRQVPAATEADRHWLLQPAYWKVVFGCL